MQPIRKIEKQAVGWRLVHPDTKESMHLPGFLNKELEAWYVNQWLQEGEPMYTFELPLGGKWTADFSSMRAYENTAGQTLVAVKVSDSMTFTLDRSSSAVDHFYNERTITISAVPEGCDERLKGQERKVSAYSGLLRTIRTDSPFIPPPPPGIEVTVGGKMGTAYRQMLPPGMDYTQIEPFELDEQPSRRAKARYQAWMQQARDTTKYRLKHETHFPIESEPPPTTDFNIVRLNEMRAKSVESQAKSKKAREEQMKFGRVDANGLHHFSGREMSEWQAARYTRWSASQHPFPPPPSLLPLFVCVHHAHTHTRICCMVQRVRVCVCV